MYTHAQVADRSNEYRNIPSSDVMIMKDSAHYPTIPSPKERDSRFALAHYNRIHTRFAGVGSGVRSRESEMLS